jgi:hypothetical protein
MEGSSFDQLISFLNRVPAIQQGISYGQYDDQNWWIKFSINIANDLAWNVVQEFGHILNCVSVEARLPVVFYPVSAPPYMNGGPEDFLYWIIESKEKSFTPDKLKEWLAGRLPDPVDNIEEWATED